MAVTRKQIKSAAASYTTEPEQERQPAKEKKTTTSFYIYPSLYADVKRLAGYRRISTGSLINEILSDYITAHRDELEAYDKFTAKMEAIKK